MTRFAIFLYLSGQTRIVGYPEGFEEVYTTVPTAELSRGVILDLDRFDQSADDLFNEFKQGARTFGGPLAELPFILDNDGLDFEKRIMWFDGLAFTLIPMWADEVPGLSIDHEKYRSGDIESHPKAKIHFERPLTLERDDGETILRMHSETRYIEAGPKTDAFIAEQRQHNKEKDNE